MRQLLRGYTMYVGGDDYGYEVETVGIMLPEENYTDHKYGGTVMTAQVPVLNFNSLEPTIKMGAYNPKLLSYVNRPLGVRDIFTFRSANVDEEDGKTHSGLIVYEGRLSSAKPSEWSKESKSEIDYTIKGVWYFKYMIDDELISEVGLKPAIWRGRGGVDYLADINRALGR